MPDLPDSTTRRTFQSTPSGGKATGDPVLCKRIQRVSIHAFRGEGDGEALEGSYALLTVSIHAFRGEGDWIPSHCWGVTDAFQSTPSGGKATECDFAITCIVPMFQSTPSGGKATAWANTYEIAARVSIHAFRGEGDICGLKTAERTDSFNPRLPGGRRLGVLIRDIAAVAVSIHAFRGEGD